ncbi:MAG TPA: hypothetical protein PLP23_23110 [Panacibacter sp.]|nr:hypothetical protein [Panacibacter sp.]
MPKPSFALNYWRPWEKNSNVIDSWLNYNRDVSLIEYQAEVLNKNLSHLSISQINSINTLSEKVNEGVSLLMAGLGVINKSIALTNQRLETLIQIEVANNIILDNIQELIKVPEREKERAYHIQSGLKFLKHAFLKNEFYDDAYNEFKQAEALKKQDYYTLYNIGMIELYSSKHTNIASAKNYFDKAIKYALIDENTQEYKYLSNLFSKQYGLKTDINGKLFISICYIQSSICSYILGNDIEAFNTLVDVMPCDENDEVYYFASKYASRAGRNETVYPLLDYYLKRNIDKLNKIISDLDFITNPEINEYITKFIDKIESDFTSFENTYKGKNEYLIYKFINDSLQRPNFSIASKYKLLNYFTPAYIADEIQKEQTNKTIDESIKEKRIEIKNKKAEHDLLIPNANVLEEKVEHCKKLSEEFPKGSDFGDFVGIIFTVIVLIPLSVIVYKLFTGNPYDEDERLLANPVVQIFLWIIFFIVLKIGYENIYVRAGKSHYKKEYDMQKDELNELNKKTRRISREIDILNSEIETLTSKKFSLVYDINLITLN